MKRVGEREAVRSKGRRLEERRIHAVRLLEEGHAVGRVAHIAGVTPSAVLQWRASYREQGWEGLRASPRPGARPRLDRQAQGKLLEMLARKPSAFGFEFERWSLESIAELISREFSVRYHPAHVWRILRRLGWPRPADRSGGEREPAG